MTDTLSDNLAREVTEAREKIATLKAEAAEKKTEADNLVTSYREQGTNPVTDKEAFEAVDTAYKASGKLLDEADEYRRRIDQLAEQSGAEVADKAKGDPRHPAVASFVERFASSDAYAAIQRELTASNPSGVNGVPSVDIASYEETKAMLFKAAISSDTIPTDQRLWPPTELPARELRVRDLVNVSGTSSDTVEFTRQTVRDNNVAFADYGTALSESNYTIVKESTTVKRLGHHTPATEGELMDTRQLEGLIDNELVYGVGEFIDSQMVNGDGLGDNFEGMLNAGGIGSVGYQEVGPGDDDVHVSDALHRALTVVRLAGKGEPSGYIIHPNDHERHVLAKDTQGGYVNVVNAVMSAPATIWGKPSVINEVVGEGTSLTGVFKRAATLYPRTGISIRVTDSHNGEFLTGILRIKAVTRAAFAVRAPFLLCEVTGLNA